MLRWGQTRPQTTDSCGESGGQQADAEVRSVSLENLPAADRKSTELEHLLQRVPNAGCQCDLQQSAELRGSELLAGAKDEALGRARRQGK